MHTSHLSQTYFAKSIIESTDIRKSANNWTTNQKISQYCLSCALNSHVKQPQDGSPQLHPGPLQTLLEGHLVLLAHWTSPVGRRVRFWLRLWASVCKVTAASLVTPTAMSGTDAVCVLHSHPVGGKASQLPCDGYSDWVLARVINLPNSRTTEEAYSAPVGGKDYMQRWRTGLAV